ncbi:DnaB Replicative DNA helicase [uncultured Caudovirales phage]|uniref:DnaB-like replicative helicase n=1 Tax=uncultured Caudovirales phage TaxID=2100421 RepID=A0A6J5LIK0_9CAUD|nr:DnaB Replicative DNA helicase [uncultured Caudovirales phage]
MKLEQTILRNLIYDEDYLRKTLPFIKEDYFSERAERVIFQAVSNFTENYNSLPSVEALTLEIKEKKNLTDDEVAKCESYLADIASSQVQESKPEANWLIDKTENFCQEKAIYNAVLDSIQILDGKDKSQEKGAIPKILSDALAISFDSSVGHDYLQDSDSRYEFYHRKEERIPFDLDCFNKITKGGLPKKTLNIALAGTGVGKSLFMCHVAAGAMVQGKNVLYITMEMAEEKIAERIDANLLNVTLDDLMELPKDLYDKKVAKVTEKTTGKLIIKEYPTASASVTHFRTLLNELNLKRNFIPDIIFIDYLNICCSSRIKASANINSYTYVKSIAEELRGLAVEYAVPIVSATQTTRSGFTSSDPGLEDTSESFGLPATADLMFALITSEELEELGQIMVKQLKNRYSDPTYYKRFTVGVDRAKMKLYDIEQSGQTGLADSGHQDKPVNTFGNRETKKSFEGFKT